MLSDDNAVEQIAFGKEGIIVGAHPDLIAIDSSTVLPITTLKAALEFKRLGIEFLDAPNRKQS